MASKEMVEAATKNRQVSPPEAQVERLSWRPEDVTITPKKQTER